MTWLTITVASSPMNVNATTKFDHQETAMDTNLLFEVSLCLVYRAYLVNDLHMAEFDNNY